MLHGSPLSYETRYEHVECVPWQHLLRTGHDDTRSQHLQVLQRGTKEDSVISSERSAFLVITREDGTGDSFAALLAPGHAADNYVGNSPWVRIELFAQGITSSCMRIGAGFNDDRNGYGRRRRIDILAGDTPSTLEKPA